MPAQARVSMERKLAAILSADVAGYSRLMGEDEEATIRTLTAYREVTDSLIHQHRGRVVNTAGDSVLAEFASAVDAVQCAVGIQQALKSKNAALPPERRMEFRIGINVGDVVAEGEQLYGDGVNVAARVQALADAGSIFISGTVYDQVKNKLALSYEDLGEQRVKNIADPVRVYRVVPHQVPSPLVGEGQGEGEYGTAGTVTPPHPNLSPQGGKEPKSPTQGLKTRLPRAAALAGIGVLLSVGIIVGVQYLSVRLPASSANIPPQQASALPLPDKPSIAVLPFTNMSEDPQQDPFSDGITEDLTADLAKISSLFVISRHSAFTYKGKTVKVQDVSRELGVRYVLEGSVRKADNQVRITAQLIDATTGGHLWSERYDRPLHDIFALQDEIRHKIVVYLALKLTDVEQERLERMYTGNPEAYEYRLRGTAYFLRLTKEDNARARQMSEQAITLDPTYAQAYALQGFTHWAEWSAQWSQDPQIVERALALAQQALTLDDSLPQAHELMGFVLLAKKQPEQASAEFERVIAHSSNWSSPYAGLAASLNAAGRPAEAIAAIEKALRLEPRNPFFLSNYLTALGGSYRLLRRYEEAITVLKRALTLNPRNFGARQTLAVVYSELGREAEAQAEVGEILKVSPNFSLEGVKQRLPFKDPAEAERVLAALRKAGLK